MAMLDSNNPKGRHASARTHRQSSQRQGQSSQEQFQASQQVSANQQHSANQQAFANQQNLAGQQAFANQQHNAQQYNARYSQAQHTAAHQQVTGTQQRASWQGNRQAGAQASSQYRNQQANTQAQQTVQNGYAGQMRPTQEQQIYGAQSRQGKGASQQHTRIANAQLDKNAQVKNASRRRPAKAGNSQMQQADFGEQTKKKKSPWTVVYIASIVVLCASLIALGVIFFQYWKEANTYNEVEEKVLDSASLKLADMKVDWEKLLAENPDTVGWVYIPDTEVSYPIVQTTNNSKYLKTNFQGETNWVVSVGAIFMDMNNSSTWTDDNSVTYGHNMNDGSMYSIIASMADSEEFNKHRDVYILTPYGNYRVRTFALIHTSGNDTLVQTMFGGDTERIQYINDKLSRSVVTPSGTLPSSAEMKRICTFATCDNNQDNMRYVMFGYVAESTFEGFDGAEQTETTRQKTK